ncbi:cobalt chelatase [Paraburkholderia sp. NMBU_R16]|uniref:cobaltochelatase CobT-related protein n=1 Tax=Paraburkholderia sp. NMBU_R16 TaxID=2698676 RepID=UPI001564DD4B|nr:cobalt chelatase [Paraburkholderia sp. NMBU_R16]NRO96647.1 cobalt chelatase [Paraburkholderia sp. NMBU_R16]
MKPLHDSAATAVGRERLCAAVVRAYTGDAALHYRAGRLCRQVRPLPLFAPHLRSDAQQDDFASLRGAADCAAMRLVHSDAALHRQLSPDAYVERWLFEMFEQIRCESLAPPGMSGLAANLRNRFEGWSRAYHRAGLVDSQLGILIYTVLQVVWSRVTGSRVLEETEDLIEATRAGIVPTIGVCLTGLRRNRFDQRGYAQHARELAHRVTSKLEQAGAMSLADAAADGRDADDALTSFSLWVDFEGTDEAFEAGNAAQGTRVANLSVQRYHAYTTQFDREVSAGALVRQPLLREYRERLDERIARCGFNIARVARALEVALSAPQRDGWSFGEEAGRIDGRRLAQIVSSPAERRVFVQERVRPRGDCAIGFLIDCSASMKAHVDTVAVLVDSLVRASEHAGLTTEIQGFTTLAWNGGRARMQWLGKGRPPHPGRLNETCHMVFKAADVGWRRARTDIAALFKADLFREGVDGEAIDWSCRRLAARAVSRRILVVISDGSPMDAATSQANGPSYLDDHLKDVLLRHESVRDVEILGLGMGCDLSTFYRHCTTVDPAAPLDTKRLLDLAQWIGQRRG